MHRRCTGHKQSMDDNFEKTLERLKTDYIEGSGDKGADFVDLQRDIHSLKGSAGTFGF
jgi:HPt (histidine-containing phosphotransfer) domain-containing protein